MDGKDLLGELHRLLLLIVVILVHDARHTALLEENHQHREDYHRTGGADTHKLKVAADGEIECPEDHQRKSYGAYCDHHIQMSCHKAYLFSFFYQTISSLPTLRR